MDNKEQVILGIDPGTNNMGYGIIRIKDKQISVVKMGVLKIEAKRDPLLKLKDIFETTSQLIQTYSPNVLSIEAPFYGKNIQSMLKLGRAQGVAIVAAVHRDIAVFEYSPRKVKLAITGKGSASKEQVAAMLHHLVDFDYAAAASDATDALAIAICHHIQNKSIVGEKHYSGWDAFFSKNPQRVRTL
jgi:crossover junction endodeoxyribonuclease RuvC